MEIVTRRHTTKFCDTILAGDMPTYGAALLAAAFAGVLGTGSPGFEGLLLSLLLCILLLLWSKSRVPLWKICLCLLVLQFGLIAPKRAVSMGIRELSGMRYHLEIVANMAAAFWMVIGASSVIRRLFQHGLESRSASSLGNNISQKIGD